MNNKTEPLTSSSEPEFFGDDIEISDTQAEGMFSLSDDAEDMYDDDPEPEHGSDFLPEPDVPKGDSPKSFSPVPLRIWFCTFMIMNLPIIGWVYLLILARRKNGDQRQDFAKAYLLYKLVFLLVALAILAVLLFIGLELADNLLEYMEML